MLFSISQKKKKKSATQPRFLEKHTEDENVLLTSTGEVVFKVTLVLCLCLPINRSSARKAEVSFIDLNQPAPFPRSSNMQVTQVTLSSSSMLNLIESP